MLSLRRPGYRFALADAWHGQTTSSASSSRSGPADALKGQVHPISDVPQAPSCLVNGSLPIDLIGRPKDEYAYGGKPIASSSNWPPPGSGLLHRSWWYRQWAGLYASGSLPPASVLTSKDVSINTTPSLCSMRTFGIRIFISLHRRPGYGSRLGPCADVDSLLPAPP